MAATKNLEAFGGNASLICTQASLASGSARETAQANNTVNLAFDDEITTTFTIASGSPSTSGAAVNVYANGTYDSTGTVWPIIQLSNGATFQTGGGDASVGALSATPNIQLIGSFGLLSTSSSGERTFRSQPRSVAQAFGGVLPPYYSLIIENQSGVAFSSSTATTAQNIARQPITTTSGN